MIFPECELRSLATDPVFFSFQLLTSQIRSFIVLPPLPLFLQFLSLVSVPLEVCLHSGKPKACLQILPMWHLVSLFSPFSTVQEHVVTWPYTPISISSHRLLVILWITCIHAHKSWIYYKSESYPTSYSLWTPGSALIPSVQTPPDLKIFANKSSPL